MAGLGKFTFIILKLRCHCNVLIKFDMYYDMYLIAPASNSKSCQLEVDLVEEWAKDINIVLNRLKSAERPVSPAVQFFALLVT